MDHTCYTISTAGSEGFLSLLPVYLDHVFYPTLKVYKLYFNTNNKNDYDFINYLQCINVLIRMQDL